MEELLGIGCVIGPVGRSHRDMSRWWGCGFEQWFFSSSGNSRDIAQHPSCLLHWDPWHPYGLHLPGCPLDPSHRRFNPEKDARTESNSASFSSAFRAAEERQPPAHKPQAGMEPPPYMFKNLGESLWLTFTRKGTRLFKWNSSDRF